MAKRRGVSGIRSGRRGLSRREFLAGLAATTGALALGGCGDDDGMLPGEAELQAAALADPQSSGIEHIVVVMMENRSFDHYLGWVPGADGRQAGQEFTDKTGAKQRSFALAPDYQNCRFHDPDHSYNGGRKQFNGGACDGFLQASTSDVFPIGYYTQTDLSFFGAAVPQWTTFDRYFCSIMGPTFPNRFFMHTGQTDRLNNAQVVFPYPTIWDRIFDNGLTGRYYFGDGPFTVFFGNRQAARVNRNFSRFADDVARGDLANLTYIDPRFGGASIGLSNDDHPLADIRNGQAFLARIYDVLTKGPDWESTVLVINYDEWGGFADHVPPPLAPQTALDPMIGNDGRLGFRVPCVLISPLARRGYVSHQQYDHTSILRMIEWRWGLEPLSVRDATANNMAEALDLVRPKNLAAPSYAVPPGPFGVDCSAAAALGGEPSDLAVLHAMAKRMKLPDIPD